MGSLTESGVEEAALAGLAALGYTVLHGPENPRRAQASPAHAWIRFGLVVDAAARAGAGEVAPAVGGFGAFAMG